MLFSLHRKELLNVVSFSDFANCQDAFTKGFKYDGVYPINLSQGESIDVSCDMETDGGGWIVIQRRMDATVDFYRGWNDYKVGFGNLSGNFWLGLEKIHKLAAPGKRAILRVEIKHVDFGEIKYASYSKFEISGEAQSYKLNIGGYNGNAGDSLTIHNDRKFSTYDRDNDLAPSNCAKDYKGAWWYNGCHYSNLNGRYPPDNYAKPDYMSWWKLKEQHGKVTSSEMKIKYQ